jgi:hypothetical protein
LVRQLKSHRNQRKKANLTDQDQDPVAIRIEIGFLPALGPERGYLLGFSSGVLHQMTSPGCNGNLNSPFSSRMSFPSMVSDVAVNEGHNANTSVTRHERFRAPIRAAIVLRLLRHRLHFFRQALLEKEDGARGIGNLCKLDWFSLPYAAISH